MSKYYLMRYEEKHVNYVAVEADNEDEAERMMGELVRNTDIPFDGLEYSDCFYCAVEHQDKRYRDEEVIVVDKELYRSETGDDTI